MTSSLAALRRTELRLHRVATLEVGLAGEQVFGQVENRITSERPEVRPVADLSF